MKVYVAITEPNGENASYEVGETPARLGRSPEADIAVNDPLCSNAHARLFTRGNELYVEDLESKNGTSLNGIKIRKQRMYIGDEIRLGETKVEIDLEKNGEDILAFFTAKNRRSDGEITLELETSRKLLRQNANKGVNKGVKEQIQRGPRKEKAFTLNRHASKKRGLSASEERAAKGIDLALAGAVFITGLALTGLLAPNAASYLKLGAGALAGILFHQWNKGKSDGSIGRRVINQRIIKK